jgi:hypothetical protein
MKHLTIEDVEPLNMRLRSLGAETIIGFPNTNDNEVLKLRAFHDIGDTALFHLTDFARATIDRDLLERFSFRADGWPVGIKTWVTRDWHKLKVDLPTTVCPNDYSEQGRRITEASRKEQFVSEFNTLMQTAAGEGWLLGFGWDIDTRPPGDFGNDPPAPHFSRILMPQEPGSVGLRESLIGVASMDYGDGVAEALHSSVVNLGLAG